MENSTPLRKLECSQPTYEELKRKQPPDGMHGETSSQPTYEELKHRDAEHRAPAVDSSQPTYEELKRPGSPAR